jgi:dipeptidyl aminopeptidase/acylaminoacyl peptidase
VHGRHRSLVARGDAPVWSPDGSRVVVGRDFEPTASEYLVVVGARGERRIPQRCPGCSVMDGDPVWSPDGTRVAFTRSTDGRGRQTDELDVVRADGTGLRRVSGLTSAVRWSPDGTRLAGTQGDRRGVPHVAIVRVSDGRTTAIGARGSGGAWSPDGSQLAFVTLRGAVVVATRDGRPLRRLPGGGGRPCIASASPCVGPAWSPDGTRILFTSDRWIVVARADGSRFHRNARGTDPSWSPDGTSVVYAGFACGADQGIHVAAPTGPRRLTDHCTIRGDVGADRIRGTGGDDTIAVLGGGRDVVSCGAGRDVVRADRSDVVARDCEVVSRPR